MSIIQRERHDVHSGKKPFDEKAAALGVFMLDVDHFKKVNDLHGHEAGDAVIVEIARRLQAMMRQSDTVVRWGGEEFLVITRQSGQADAFQLAERIRLRIEQTDFQIAPANEFRKTISIGFCHYPFLCGEEEKLDLAAGGGHGRQRPLPGQAQRPQPGRRHPPRPGALRRQRAGAARRPGGGGATTAPMRVDQPQEQNQNPGPSMKRQPKCSDQ